MSKGFTRRDVLKNMGAAAGVAALAPRMLSGCATNRGPGQITTIVTVMMENRSYDHYLGARKLVENLAGDGLVAGMANPDQDGVPRLIHRQEVECVADPPHDWDSCRLQLNGGLNDGFMKTYQTAAGAGILAHVMGYFQREDLPVTWTLADASTTCDRWFSSLLGPTWPNRFYVHSGQSNGRKDNKPPETPDGFLWPTIYDRLSAKGVDWAYYYSDLPFMSLFTKLDKAKIKPVVYDFFDDCTNGKLPPVVFIDPAFSSNDDHPPHHPLLGQQFIASIYAALAASPQWENILFTVTYDEHGGFFDHVVPPTAPDERAADGFNQLGFRVPTIITGPYVKQGHVSSVPYDHTSILRHIENMHGLEPLTMRDAAANDLSDAIDTVRLAAGDAASPITLPQVMIDESMLDPMCKKGASKPTDLETLADSGWFEQGLDLRPRMKDTLHGIADHLEKRGGGGKRRGR